MRPQRRSRRGQRKAGAWLDRFSLRTQLAGSILGALVAETTFLLGPPPSWSTAFLAFLVLIVAVVFLLSIATSMWELDRFLTVVTFLAGLVLYIESFAVMYQVFNHEVRRCFAPRLAHHVDAVYFALSTFTTSGYGDIHASAPTCRWLVSTQMVIDFSVVALALAFFVAKATRVAARDPRDGKNSLVVETRPRSPAPGERH
jgi:voltage-gated potassium channel